MRFLNILSTSYMLGLARKPNSNNIMQTITPQSIFKPYKESVHSFININFDTQFTKIVFVLITIHYI